MRSIPIGRLTNKATRPVHARFGKMEPRKELLMDPVQEMLEQHAVSESKLTVRTFTTDDEDVPLQYVLLEGDAKALRFFGRTYPCTRELG